GLVQRGGLHLVQELTDHAADPHHLGGLLDQFGDRPLVVLFALPTLPALAALAASRRRDAVRAHDENVRLLVGLPVQRLVHTFPHPFVKRILPTWPLSSSSR